MHIDQLDQMLYKYLVHRYLQYNHHYNNNLQLHVHKIFIAFVQLEFSLKPNCHTSKCNKVLHDSIINDSNNLLLTGLKVIPLQFSLEVAPPSVFLLTKLIA